MARLTVGRAILKLRAHLSIPREKLALEADVTSSAVCFWETGGRTPSAMHRERLATYARAMKAPADIILAIEPPPASDPA